MNLAKRALVCLALVGTVSCGSNQDINELKYRCETSSALSPATAEGEVCGAGDEKLPPEPTFPTDVCQTLVANKFASDDAPPDETNIDTVRIQAALNACKGRAVKLVSDGGNNAFVAAHLTIDSATLWVDGGVTLYGSRQPELYQQTGSCGVMGINDSDACLDFISVRGKSPAIVGDGVIDGQGGEPLIGHDYSWWQLSYALRKVDGSIGNPTMINLLSGTTGFLAYRITLHNSAKFHMKITSQPADGKCDAPGKGFIVWGVTVLTPSKWFNSRGEVLQPNFSRNTDGIDPGTTSLAYCGVLACNTVSTGDDHIAVKGGHWVSDLIIAHNHFGTGHGMSIGSETYGTYTSADKVVHRGVENIDIYDLTIDADSRPVGEDAQPADFNGIRIKSDESRGGVVRNISYRDVCMRDMNNTILISTAYNPLFAGTAYPEFGNISLQNIRHVSCMARVQPAVTLNGFNASLPLGPISLDNVVVDNMGPQAVSAQYADIHLGPGEVNFMPSGRGVNVTDSTAPGSSKPRRCVFPTLPAPKPPAGWLR